MDNRIEFRERDEGFIIVIYRGLALTIEMKPDTLVKDLEAATNELLEAAGRM